jgi:hypothetical protein
MNLHEIKKSAAIKSNIFWIFMGIDLLICSIVAAFFAIGLVDGSVSSYNLDMWIGILVALSVVIAGGLWIKVMGYSVIGTVLLLILAIPGIICGFIILVTLVTNARWN